MKKPVLLFLTVLLSGTACGSPVFTPGVVYSRQTLRADKTPFCQRYACQFDRHFILSDSQGQTPQAIVTKYTLKVKGSRLALLEFDQKLNGQLRDVGLTISTMGKLKDHINAVRDWAVLLGLPPAKVMKVCQAIKTTNDTQQMKMGAGIQAACSLSQAPGGPLIITVTATLS